MKTVVCLLTGTALALGLTLTARAGGEDTKRVDRISTLSDLAVKNSEDETLGYVEDFVIDAKTGKIVYAAMSHGEVLGFGGSMFAVAPEALKLSPKRDYFIMDAQPSDFENKKGFNQNEWPARPEFGTKGAKGNAGENNRQGGDKEQRLTRTSSLIGLSVEGKNGKSLGSVYDLAADWNQHKIKYAAISYGAVAGVGGELIAVNWDAFQVKSPTFQPRSSVLYLNATQQDMEAARGFTSDEAWPTTGDDRFKTAQTGASAER